MTVASNVNQCLATIRAIEAQLSSLALTSLDEEAKRLFHETMLEIGDIKKDLQSRKTELEFEEPQYKPN
ncbi:uncharacterized protein DUF1657 [Cytobacillus oceanisediminis]|jgi:hypothetical protein|uniref:Uncharacterized protein DUF1657 n=1 Tax=Cytobacillus oceanisediminis TaxID=665099 RepID=A0A2V2ZNE9_9BACI|nr:DUF1657 domain-containing protein [Cytobacillus oceanisediminis]PWW25830.1 uncharacterized protein DUF1657 [Cytobacillus oceanisediminis]